MKAERGVKIELRKGEIEVSEVEDRQTHPRSETITGAPVSQLHHLVVDMIQRTYGLAARLRR